MKKTHPFGGTNLPSIYSCMRQSSAYESRWIRQNGGWSYSFKELLADEGAKIIVTDIDYDSVKKVGEEINKESKGRAITLLNLSIVRGDKRCRKMALL